MMLSDVCRVHRQYSWRPQLLEARRAGCRRPGVYGLELDRSVRRVQGRRHIVAASRLHLVLSRFNYSVMCSCILTAEKDVGVQRKEQRKVSTPVTPVNTTNHRPPCCLSQARKHAVFLFETNCYKKVSYHKQIARQHSCHQNILCAVDSIL